jgi:hypothetical protein
VVQRALELSGAAESALVWPRFLTGTLGRGTERMYPFARVPTGKVPCMQLKIFVNEYFKKKLNFHLFSHDRDFKTNTFFWYLLFME